MTLRFFRLMFVFGLGAVAGAVLPAEAHAQVPVRRDTTAKRDTARTPVDTVGGRRNPVPAGPDTIRVPTPPRADSMARNDSINRGSVPLPVVKRDTLKPALARSEMASVFDLGPPRVYDRAALFATGALTLSDMLARVPGLTEYTTGFLAAPALIASEGDFRRIRIFLDGLELDPMDLRSRGVAPVNDLPIHALEEVRIERGADEVRVHARTWRVDRTDPFTRADIATGDLNTNLYRAYFGRRYDRGETLQFSAEQLNTQPDTRLASSDGVSVMGRLGLQRGPWNVDATATRVSRNRAAWTGTGNQSDQLDTVPELTLVRTTAYLRLANGDPEGGRWFQAIASSNSNVDRKRASNSVLAGTSADTTSTQPDSVEYESQYVIAGGLTRGAWRLSATDRLRAGGGRAANSVSARASGAAGPVTIALFGESKSPLSPARVEGNLRFSPFDRIALIGSASRTSSANVDRLFSEPRGNAVLNTAGQFLLADTAVTDDSTEITRYQLGSRTSYRAEAGFRFRDLWVSGGVLHRGPTTLLPPAELGGVYDTRSVWRTENSATGKSLTVRGRLWRSVYADAWAVAWNDATGFYRPKYQTRTELYLQTSLLDRFPRGNFGILGSLSHEYRSSSLFPVDDKSVRTVPGYRLLSFKLEIRIQTAVVSYQFRNLLQERYAQIPGFQMPRQVQFYGVRWDFWN